MSVANRMRILKTVEWSEFVEKHPKRIHILKTVELADFVEKHPKRMNILKERDFKCCWLAKWIEAIAFFFGYARPKKKESAKCHCYFKCCCILHHSWNKALLTSGAEGFRSLKSLPFSEEPKSICQWSLGSLPKTEWPKEWAFIKSDLKSAKCTVFGRMVLKRMGFYLLPTLPFLEDAQKNTLWNKINEVWT